MQRALLLLGIIGWLAFRLYTGIVLEDALITFRYAENLATGGGFTYNAGEHVLGTTTPFFTLLLGVFGFLFGTGSIAPVALAIGISAGGAAAWFLHAALVRLGWSNGLCLFVTGCFLFHPETLWTTTGGMETPLVLCLMAISLHALARGASVTAATAAALLILTRIDGAIWAAVIYAAIVIKDRPAWLRSLLVMGVVLLPWLAFAFWYFGSPVPHSVIAKQAMGAIPDPFTRGHLMAFVSWVAPFVGSIWPSPAWIGLVLFAAGGVFLFRKGSPHWLWPIAAFPILFPAVLFAGRSPLYFDWYMAPIRLPALVVGGLGVWGLAARVKAHLPGRSVRAVAAAALVSYGVFVVWLDAGIARFHRDYQVNEDGARKKVGVWLDGNTPHDAVVAMEAIGYQGYYSRRRVIDLAGLVSPDVVRIRKLSPGNGDAFHRILVELQPDYLVLRSFEVDRNVHFHGGPLFETNRTAAWFRAHYEEVERFEAPLVDVWGPTAYLTVYRRRS